jgi:hypothetical protein
MCNATRYATINAIARRADAREALELTRRSHGGGGG